MPVEDHKRDLVVTRVVDAPVGQVWQAWTDPELVRRWWGPTGFTCPLARIDLREGGTSLVAMRSPAGQDLYNTWAYRSIVPHQRLEFIQNFADQAGNKLAPASIGLPPEIPQDVRNVVTFKALGEHRTELTVTDNVTPPTRSWSYPRPAWSKSSTSWPPASNNPAMHVAALGCGRGSRTPTAPATPRPAELS